MPLYSADALILRTYKLGEADRIVVFLTRDRDFGNLTFVQALGAGVIFLRILPSTQISVHQELERALRLHTEEELLDRFTVVEPGRHRVRHYPGGADSG